MAGKDIRLVIGDLPVDNFQQNVTEPNDTNVGPRVKEISLQNYAGTFTNVKDNEPIKRLIIPGSIDLGASKNAHVEDCIVLGGPAPVAGTTYPLIKALNGNLNTVIEFTEIRPSHPSVDVYGVQGGDITFRRSKVTGVVDAFSINGSSSAGARHKIVVIEDSLIKDLPFYASDPRQVDGSHNDGIQGAGVLDLTVRGTAIHGGVTSCILLQKNQGIYTKALVEYCWLYGHPTSGSTFNTSEDGRGPIENLTFRYSKVDRNGKAPRILIASATLAAGTTDIHDIVFMDDGSPVPINNGG